MKNSYSLPIKKNAVEKCVRKSPAHNGKLKHSVDFLCKEGTPIYAAAKGTVVWLRKNSNQGGPHKKYWFKGNRIVIEHKNSEYTGYEHLKYRGVLVKLRQIVRKGQLIGYSGNTGYSFAPHLHFEVFVDPAPDKSEGTTIKVEFKDLKK